MFYDEELDQSDKFYGGQPLLLQLCYALYNILVAHSEFVCYLVIIINNMVSASCVTLVLPITIFLWAMLSVPRPSKRFWMTAIVYTEVQLADSERQPAPLIDLPRTHRTLTLFHDIINIKLLIKTIKSTTTTHVRCSSLMFQNRGKERKGNLIFFAP